MVSPESKGMSSVSPDPEGAGSVTPDPEGASSVSPDPSGADLTSPDPSKGDYASPDGGPYRLQPLRVKLLTPEMEWARLDVTRGQDGPYLRTHVANSVGTTSDRGIC